MLDLIRVICITRESSSLREASRCHYAKRNLHTFHVIANEDICDVKYLFFQVSYKELPHSVNFTSNKYYKDLLSSVFLWIEKVRGGVRELTIGAPVGELPS